MYKYKVLYTDTGIDNIDTERDVLARGDTDLIMASAIDADTLIREGSDCDGIMVNYAIIDKDILDAWGKSGRVQVVSRQGIGVNNIDLEAASMNRIMVANVIDYCLEEVADHTMALVLNLMRGIQNFSKRVREGDFSEIPSKPIHRLRGMNFCLYGFGNIAKAVANRASSFGFQVFAWDPYVPTEEFVTCGVQRVSSLKALAELADVFSIHAPLNENTIHSVNKMVFESMKSTAIIINTARGPIINEKDLIDALINEKLYGAGLDVLEEEPPSDSNPLLKMENVIITPHVSWFSNESDEELRRKIAENIILTFTEGSPKGFVNRNAFE